MYEIHLKRIIFKYDYQSELIENSLKDALRIKIKKVHPDLYDFSNSNWSKTPIQTKSPTIILFKKPRYVFFFSF
jgi:hypothetical protein